MFFVNQGVFETSVISYVLIFNLKHFLLGVISVAILNQTDAFADNGCVKC